MHVLGGEIVGHHGKEGAPRARNDVFAVVVTAIDDNLSPGTAGTGGKVDSKVVASPVASKRNPGRMRVGLLHGVWRLRVLAGEQVLAPERVAGALDLGDGRCGGGAGKGLDGDLGRAVVDLGGQVFLSDLAPVLPLHDDFLAIEQHEAEEDTRGETAALLAVVDLQRLADVHGQGGVELVLELVDVVGGAALAHVVKQLGEVVLDPAVDALPRVGDGGRGGQALVEVLHLDLAGGALVERVRVERGLAAEGAAHAGRVGGAGRHGALWGADEAIARGQVVVLVGRVEVGARLCARGGNRGEGGVAALGDGDVTAGPIGRVVRGVTVVRGHCVPEVLQGRRDSAHGLAMGSEGSSGGVEAGEAYC